MDATPAHSSPAPAGSSYAFESPGGSFAGTLEETANLLTILMLVYDDVDGRELYGEPRADATGRRWGAASTCIDSWVLIHGVSGGWRCSRRPRWRIGIDGLSTTAQA